MSALQLNNKMYHQSHPSIIFSSAGASSGPDKQEPLSIVQREEQHPAYDDAKNNKDTFTTASPKPGPTKSSPTEKPAPKSKISLIGMFNVGVSAGIVASMLGFQAESYMENEQTSFLSKLYKLTDNTLTSGLHGLVLGYLYNATQLGRI
jgi:hypothetical protein